LAGWLLNRQPLEREVSTPVRSEYEDLCWQCASTISAEVKSLSWLNLLRRSAVVPGGFPSTLSEAQVCWVEKCNGDPKAILPWVFAVVLTTALEPNAPERVLRQMKESPLNLARFKTLEAVVIALQNNLIRCPVGSWSERVDWWCRIASLNYLEKLGETTSSELLFALSECLNLLSSKGEPEQLCGHTSANIQSPAVETKCPSVAGFIQGRGLLPLNPQTSEEVCKGWREGLATHVSVTTFANDLRRYFRYQGEGSSRAQKFMAHVLLLRWQNTKVTDVPGTLSELGKLGILVRSEEWKDLAFAPSENPKATLREAEAFRIEVVKKLKKWH